MSRQRIYQVAVFFPERPWVRRGDCADLVGSKLLLQWARDGYVRLSPSGLVLREEVEDRFIELVERPCQYPGCEELIGSVASNARFCAECSLKVQKYNYLVLSAEQRANHHAAVRRWQEKNPDRAAEIQRRAERAYRERKRARDAHSESA